MQLSWFLAAGFGCKRDMDDSVRHLTMAAELNNPTAELFIHRIFEALRLAPPILKPDASLEVRDDTPMADLGDTFLSGNYYENAENSDSDPDSSMGSHDDLCDEGDDDDGSDDDDDDGYSLFHLGGALHRSLVTPPGVAPEDRYCALMRTVYHRVIAESFGCVPLISENGKSQYKNIEDPALARDSKRLLRQKHTPIVLYRMSDGTYVGEHTLHLAAVCGAAELIQRLLDQGADINEHDVEGHTPLYCATRHGHAVATRLLVSRGADASIETPSGHCALHNLWVFESSDIPEMARLLVKANAKVNAVSHLNLADSLCHLMEYGSALHVSVAMRSPTAIRSLIDQGADVNLRPPNALYTPLELASYYHFPEIVDLLLRCGASIYPSSKEGNGWALHAAAHAKQPMLR